MKWRIGIIGLGNVGRGVLQILYNKQNIFQSRYNFEYEVVAIAGHSKGSIIDKNGIDIKRLLDVLSRDDNIKRYSEKVEDIETMEIIRNTNADIIVECTPTNIRTGEPGLSHIRTALDLKKHVVTTNKGPIALAYRELLELARKRNVQLRFEGTVLSGTPAISVAMNDLAGCDIEEIEGILNGTTNYILTRMEQGMSYDNALKEAQRRGYAEADPKADVEGWDAAVKGVILANVVMNSSISLDDVDLRGITDITKEDVMDAVANNERIKLIVSVKRQNDSVIIRVAPHRIPITHPFASVINDTNAIRFKTDHLGDVVVIGPGAGPIGTGQAVLTDILAIHHSSNIFNFS